MYQSLLKGTNVYIIDFVQDFSDKIDVSDISSTGINFSIYTTIADPNVLLGYSKVDKLVSFDNTNIILSKEYTTVSINPVDGSEIINYVDEVIPQSSALGSVTQLLKQSCSNGDFSVSLTNNPINSLDGSTINIQFDPEITYKLVLDLNTLLVDETQSKLYTFAFMTTTSTVNSVVYNPYPNNVLTSINKLNTIQDVDTVLDLGGGLNYEFTSTNNEFMQFDINSTLESLYVKQYLSEYVSYFNTINQADVTMDDLTKKQLTDLKKILLKNSNLVNSSFKGNEQGMTIVFNIFCQALGKFLVNLEPSPVLKNFVYRITTSLHKEYWLGDIKNIVHPVSWSDEYVYVDIISTLMNLWYSVDKNVPNKICRSYLDISYKQRYHLYPDVFDMSIFEDYHTNKKFDFNVNEYTANTSGYNNIELISELSDINSLVVNYSLQEYYNKLDIDFIINGVALEYEFNIRVRDKLFQTINSYTPNISINLPYSAEEFSVDVTLINNDFSLTVPQKSFSINTLNTTLFDNTTLSNLIFKIHEFILYEWIILDTDKITPITTITTTENYVDVLDYYLKYLQLKVHYHDGSPPKIINDEPYVLMFDILPIEEATIELNLVIG